IWPVLGTARPSSASSRGRNPAARPRPFRRPCSLMAHPTLPMEKGPRATAAPPWSADEDAAEERAVEGEETGVAGRARPAEGADVRPAARPGPGNDLGLAVAVRVRSGDGDAAAEGGVVGEELVRERPVTAEGAGVRPAAGAGAGDDLGATVAVQ